MFLVARFDQHNKFVWFSVDGHEQPPPLPIAARCDRSLHDPLQASADSCQRRGGGLVRAPTPGSRQRLRRAVPAGQAGGSPGPAAGLLRRQDHPDHRLACGGVDGLLAAAGLLVAVGHRGVPGVRLHPGRLPRARRRPPAGLPHPAAQRPGWPRLWQPAHRAELRLVGRQAQPPPQQPQPCGPGPRRHRRRDVVRRPACVRRARASSGTGSPAAAASVTT
jgi:hypothetical protein